MRCELIGTVSPPPFFVIPRERLLSEMQKSVLEGGYRYADLVQIGVENDKMQRELLELGIDFYKMHRLYLRLL